MNVNKFLPTLKLIIGMNFDYIFYFILKKNPITLWSKIQFLKIKTQ